MTPSDPTFSKRITGAYVGALTALAVWAGVGYWLPRAELRFQQTSAAVLSLMDRQHILLERTALLAENYVKTPDSARRAHRREELHRAVEQMAESQAALLAADPRLDLPAALDAQLRQYIANVRALLAMPETELTADHPLSQAIYAQATGPLAEDLDAWALAYQQLDAAGIRRVQQVTTGLFLGQLGALALLGWLVFRPLVRRVQSEHEERLRSSRLDLIGTMAAKFAHEIRNPLGSIRLNFDAIRDELTPQTPAPHVPKLLSSIDAELRRIQRISAGYLQFARLPKGALAPLAVNEWLAQQLQFLAAEFAQRGLRLTTQFSAGLPRVRADAGQLWQAILNIVRNAWEAMPAGGVLTVRTAAGPACVRVEIHDTGHGMTEEQLRAVFQPFATFKEGGTGLGMVLTQQIIHEHGGRITCASQPGQGTTFTIELPALREP
jgi:signal transduction histidine kinase